MRKGKAIALVVLALYGLPFLVGCSPANLLSLLKGLTGGAGTGAGTGGANTGGANTGGASTGGGRNTGAGTGLAGAGDMDAGWSTAATTRKPSRGARRSEPIPSLGGRAGGGGGKLEEIELEDLIGSGGSDDGEEAVIDLEDLIEEFGQGSGIPMDDRVVTPATNDVWEDVMPQIDPDDLPSSDDIEYYEGV